MKPFYPIIDRRRAFGTAVHRSGNVVTAPQVFEFGRLHLQYQKAVGKLFLGKRIPFVAVKDLPLTPRHRLRYLGELRNLPHLILPIRGFEMG